MKELMELNPKSVFDDIARIIPKLHGWASVEKAVSLAAYAIANKPLVSVQLGVYGGRDSLPVAMACKFNKRGIIHCVDPWSPQASADGQVTDVDRKWWGDLNHEFIYQGFVDAVNRNGLQEYCVIHRMKSSEFESPPEIGYLAVDGNHGPDAVLDTMKFGANVIPGGIVCLDDCTWAGGYVQKSAEWLKENGFLELHPLGTGALYWRQK